MVAFDADGSEIGIVFEIASPFETPYEMEKLVGWLDQTIESKTLHLTLKSKLLKYSKLES